MQQVWGLAAAPGLAWILCKQAARAASLRLLSVLLLGETVATARPLQPRENNMHNHTASCSLFSA